LTEEVVPFQYAEDDHPPVQMVPLFEILVPFTKDLVEMVWCYLQSIRYLFIWHRDAYITCKGLQYCQAVQLF